MGLTLQIKVSRVNNFTENIEWSQVTTTATIGFTSTKVFISHYFQLEVTARYTGLLLAPAEGFSLGFLGNLTTFKPCFVFSNKISNKKKLNKNNTKQYKN